MSPSTPFKVVNRVINVRPIVSLAAKFVGSGPSRLKMIKLSHELNHEGVRFWAGSRGFPEQSLEVTTKPRSPWFVE